MLILFHCFLHSHVLFYDGVGIGRRLKLVWYFLEKEGISYKM